MNRQSELLLFFFYRAVLPDLSDSRRNQKNLRTENYTFSSPNFSKPWNFSVKDQMIWHAKKRKVNVCGWFIYRTIPWILLFLIWQSELRAASIVRVRYYTNQIVLNTLWNSYLNQATNNVYWYLYFPKFPIPKEIPWWNISKQKGNPFIISVTSTLPSPSLLFALFLLVVGSGSTLLPLPLFFLVSVSFEIS